MAVIRDKMITIPVSEIELHQFKVLADDLETSVAQMVRGWRRDAWNERASKEAAQEAAQAYSNGTPAEELDAEGA